MTAIDRIVTVTLNPTIDRLIETPGLTLGAHQKGRLLSRRPAGKAINVSRALATLGVPSLPVGWVGRDEHALFDEEVRAMGLTPRFIPIADRSRDNITLIDPQAGMATHIRDVGPRISPSELSALFDVLDEVAGPGAAIVFNGSTPDGLSPSDFAAMLKRVAAAGAALVVDTSGEALRAAVKERLFLLKVNEEELTEAVGEHDDIGTAGESLAVNVDNVLISLGESGAMLISGDTVLRANAPALPSPVLSTVGCGDSMLAGFLAALIKGEPLEECTARSVAVGSASALATIPGEFNPNIMNTLIPGVAVSSERRAHAP